MVRIAIAASAPPMSFAELALGNGVHLHYARQGSTYGPAIILLHGYSDSSFSFSRVMPLIPAEFRVIAPDLRGHGHSARPAKGYRIGDFAADVIRMMDRLNIREADIVGHSMGSFVAQAIAERAPERVARLILLGSAPVADNRVMRELRREVRSLSDPVDQWFVRAFQFSTIATPVPSAFMESASENSHRMPAHVWKKALHGLIEYRPRAPRPDVRTLVLGGNRDTVFSVAEQTALARQFKNAEQVIVDGVGHALHWERPQRFVDELLRFTL
jgi:pimeloyl-ACP methyl ester carboxylesterase